MNKIKDIILMYKNNRKLFDTIMTLVNIVLIFWQAIFSLITPSRTNVFILLLLIGALVYQLIKNP